MVNKEQNQIAGNYGNNTAIARDNITNNINIDKLSIKTEYFIGNTTDLYNQNSLRLSDKPKKIAGYRVKYLIDKLLQRLLSKNPAGIDQATDPDFLHDIFIAQRDYARCGDPELADMLITLLVERTRETERSLAQIVLNESIAIVSKLTKDEIDTLTALFVVEFHSKSRKYDNISDFANYICTYILHFWSSSRNKSFASAHLFYTGCASHMYFGTVGLEEFLKSRCDGLPVENRFNLRTSIESVDPRINPFFNQFDKSILNHMFLTTVGIAIGYANLCNVTGEEFNLSEWL